MAPMIRSHHNVVFGGVRVVALANDVDNAYQRSVGLGRRYERGLSFWIDVGETRGKYMREILDRREATEPDVLRRCSRQHLSERRLVSERIGRTSNRSSPAMPISCSSKDRPCTDPVDASQFSATS